MADRFTNPWLIVAISVSTLLQIAVVTVPALQPLFKVTPIASAADWALVAFLSLMPVTVIEVTKIMGGILPRGSPARTNATPAVT